MAEQPTSEDKARYETLKKELMQALPKKRAIDKQLAQIEVQIHNLEVSYLTETAAHSGGNIIQGFENYLKNQTGGRRRYEIHDHDRIFSHSSLTYQKSLELMGEGEESTATNEDYVKQSTPGPLTTIPIPPAARAQEMTAAQAKKIKDREYQRRKRASMNRSTGESDDEPVSATSGTSRRPTKRARLAADD
ncbi:NuA4-domain-containing protein, partial [Crepidotus variabilis]